MTLSAEDIRTRIAFERWRLRFALDCADRASTVGALEHEKALASNALNALESYGCDRAAEEAAAIRGEPCS